VPISRANAARFSAVGLKTLARAMRHARQALELGARLAARAEDADRHGAVERHPARHHAAHPAGAEVGDVSPVDQRRERPGGEIDQRNEVARAHAFDGVIGLRCAEAVRMIGGEQDAHPAARKAGGEARRDEGLARRFMAKDFFQQSNAVAIGEDAADRMMIDEYCHEHDSPVIRANPILGRGLAAAAKISGEFAERRSMLRLDFTRPQERPAVKRAPSNRIRTPNASA
jgi:hypothetical protein